MLTSKWYQKKISCSPAHAEPTTSTFKENSHKRCDCFVLICPNYFVQKIVNDYGDTMSAYSNDKADTVTAQCYINLFSFSKKFQNYRCLCL